MTTAVRQPRTGPTSRSFDEFLEWPGAGDAESATGVQDASELPGNAFTCAQRLVKPILRGRPLDRLPVTVEALSRRGFTG